MSDDNFLPITVDEVINIAVDDLIVEGVMKQDFGPWKKGNRHTLTFNFDTGVVEEHCDDGIVVAGCKIRLEAQT